VSRFDLNASSEGQFMRGVKESGQRICGGWNGTRSGGFLSTLNFKKEVFTSVADRWWKLQTEERTFNV